MENRPKDTFLLHVKNIRMFLKDLFDYMPMREDREKSLIDEIEHLSINQSSEEDFGGEIISQGRKSELKLNQIEFWRLEAGICTKLNSQ